MNAATHSPLDTPMNGSASSETNQDRQNKALQQNRGDVLRYGERVGCDLLKAAVSRLH